MEIDAVGEVSRNRRLLHHRLGCHRDRLRDRVHPIDPIKLLVWSADINGIVAVPVMAMMMLIVTSERVMGRFKARPWLAYAGSGAIALMALTAAAALASLMWTD